MAKLFKTTFKLRRGSSATWDKNNPVLEYGEPGFDKDQYIFKIGDGKKSWRDLKPIGATVQPDWNQNDETAPDFVKNRIAWEEIEKQILFPETEMTLGLEESYMIDYDLGLVEGQIYTVNWGNEVYQCKCENRTVEEGVTALCLGNLYILGELSNELPFTVFMLYYQGIFAEGAIYDALTTGEGQTYNIKVSIIGENNTVHKLDPKFYERLGWDDSTIILENTTIMVEENTGLAEIPDLFIPFKQTCDYTVILDGKTYVTSAYILLEKSGAFYCIGNQFYASGVFDELPFTIVSYGSGATKLTGIFVFNFDSTPAIGEHTISIKEGRIHQIDPKFLPPSDWNASKNEIGHILNRPFYKEIAERVEIYPETIVEGNTYSQPVVINGIIEENSEIIVYYDETEYNLRLKEADSYFIFGGGMFEEYTKDSVPFYGIVSQYINEKEKAIRLDGFDLLEEGEHKVQIFIKPVNYIDNFNKYLLYYLDIDFSFNWDELTHRQHEIDKAIKLFQQGYRIYSRFDNKEIKIINMEGSNYYSYYIYGYDPETLNFYKIHFDPEDHDHSSIEIKSLATMDKIPKTPIIKLATLLKDGVILTEEEGAMLDAAYESELPVQIKFSFYDDNVVSEDILGVFSKMSQDQGIRMYVFNFLNFQIAIFKEENQWNAYIENFVSKLIPTYTNVAEVGA